MYHCAVHNLDNCTWWSFLDTAFPRQYIYLYSSLGFKHIRAHITSICLLVGALYIFKEMNKLPDDRFLLLCLYIKDELKVFFITEISHYVWVSIGNVAFNVISMATHTILNISCMLPLLTSQNSNSHYVKIHKGLLKYTILCLSGTQNFWEAFRKCFRMWHF